jgi:signal transduction histidine kinase
VSTPALSLSHIERDAERGAVAGVCAGIAKTLDVDPTLVRLAATFLAFASGAGIVAYLGAWSLLPVAGRSGPSRQRRVMGTVMLFWSAILALGGVGLSGSIVWPLALVTVGAALLVARPQRRLRIAGVVLVVTGGILLIDQGGHGGFPKVVAPGGIAIALVLVLGPWALRLARERETERAERIRTQERADLAARVHDSVLQTLTLIQKDPSDARRLARRQERELRAWLYPATATGTLADAVDAAGAEIEDVHGVVVEVVHTGDAPLDERTQALVLAAREAMTNAAKHSGADEISVFVDTTAVYVRDRGSGFDLDAIAPDRRGVAESIRGRMERVGGSARIVTAPGEGTEVELRL